MQTNSMQTRQLSVLLVAEQPQNLAELEQFFSSDSQVHLEHASPISAIDTAKQLAPHLVVIDEDLGQIDPLELIRNLLTINAFIHTALVSSLTHQQFHETTEGLGIAAQLPPRPSATHAADLLAKIKSIGGW